MTFLERARSAVRTLEAQGLRRLIPRHDHSAVIDFASNDYLGLSRASRVVAALRESDIAGSGGSRLLSGAHPEHAALEADLARFVKRERALLFSSGYLASLGAIHTAAQLVSTAYSDAENHASIIDALRLTHLTRHVFPHGTHPIEATRTSPALIVCESVFGMNGDFADIEALLECLRESDILILDEAHALGVHGEKGGGRASAYDDERIIVVGTLSKAFGCAGGFIAGPRDFIELAINTARSFIFDTSLPPGIARAAHAALGEIVNGDALRVKLTANAARVAAVLRTLGENVDAREGAIIPLIVGDARKAMKLGELLLQRNIHAPAIRPPTVPEGTSRLRLVIRADHTDADITALTKALASFPAL